MTTAGPVGRNGHRLLVWLVIAVRRYKARDITPTGRPRRRRFAGGAGRMLHR
jgi:hypothetical protein